MVARSVLPSVLVLLVSTALRAERPVVTWNSDGVTGGQTVLITGEGFVEHKTQVVGIRLPDATVRLPDALPGAPSKPEGAQPLKILRLTSQSIAATLPASWEPGVYALWIGSGAEWSSPLLLNQAQPEWLFKETATPGSSFRIIGKNLQLAGGMPQIVFRKAGSAATVLPLVKAEKYSLETSLPVDLPAGDYEVLVSNGMGGSKAWSQPLPLHVVAATPWPSKRFDVTSFGAEGDDKTDDTAAIKKAIDAAAKSGGGIVFFPNGVYRINDTIVMPERVVLQGVARDRVWLTWPKWKEGSPEPIPAIIVGERNFGLQDLSIVFQMPIHGIIAPFDAKLARQPNPFYQLPDDRITAAGGVFIHNCTIRHLRFAPRLTKGDRRLQQAIGDPGGTTVILGGPNISLLHNDIVSWGRSLVLQSVRNGIIAGNTLGNGRNGWYSFAGAQESIIEDNQIEGDDLEGTGGSVNREFPGRLPLYHVYIAHNHYRNLYGGEREALTFDNTSPSPNHWLGRVKSSIAESTSLQSAGLTEHAVEGMQCLIVGGRGIGQLRTIVTNHADDVKPDRPWIVPPDSTSVLDIAYIPHDIIAFANDFHDSSVAVQLYGATYNFIVDGNNSTRGGGFWGYASYYSPGPRYQQKLWNHLAPMYYAQFLNNRVLDGYVYEQGPSTGSIGLGGMIGLVVNPWAPENMSIELGFGIVIQRNELDDAASIVVRTGMQEPQEPVVPVISNVLVEDNRITAVKSALMIGPGTDGVVLHNNRFEGVVHPLIDRGRNTVIAPDSGPAATEKEMTK